VQNFNHLVLEEHVQIRGWLVWVGNSIENWLYLENGESYRPRLLLITNRKWHTLCQTRWKSLTLNDLEGQYCNKNCTGCSAFSLRSRFCEKNLRNLRPIFLLVIYDCSCLYRLARRPCVTSRDVCYTVVNCSFRQQRYVSMVCMELCHFWEIAFSLWLEVGR